MPSAEWRASDPSPPRELLRALTTGRVYDICNGSSQTTRGWRDAMGTDSIVQMELNQIRIDERRSEQVIVLKEKTGKRLLPIVIGISEVSAIKMKVSGIEPPRPMTHDLLVQALTHLGASIERIIVDRLENNTFYAKILVKDQAGQIKEVDARPSDSIALALRAESPIFVADEVLKKVGLVEGG